MQRAWQVKSDEYEKVKGKRRKAPLAEVVLTDEDTEGFGIQLNAGGLEKDDPGRCRFFGNLGEMERLHAALGKAIRLGRETQEKEIANARRARILAPWRKAFGKWATQKHTPKGTRKKALSDEKVRVVADLPPEAVGRIARGLKKLRKSAA